MATETIASTIITECVKQGIMTNQEGYVFLNAVLFMYSEHTDRHNPRVLEEIGKWGCEGLERLIHVK